MGLGGGLVVTAVFWGICLGAYFWWASHEQKKSREEES